MKEGDKVWIKEYGSNLPYTEHQFIRHGEFYCYQHKGIESGIMVLSWGKRIEYYFPTTSDILIEKPTENER